MDEEFLMERMGALYKKALQRKPLPNAITSPTIPHPCGNGSLAFQLKVEGGKLKPSFIANGCFVSLSSAEALAEWLEGKPVEEAMALDEDAFFSLLPVDLSKSYRRACAIVPFLAFRNALKALTAQRE